MASISQQPLLGLPSFNHHFYTLAINSRLVPNPRGKKYLSRPHLFFYNRRIRSQNLLQISRKGQLKKKNLSTTTNLRGGVSATLGKTRISLKLTWIEARIAQKKVFYGIFDCVPVLIYIAISLEKTFELFLSLGKWSDALSYSLIAAILCGILQY